MCVSVHALVWEVCVCERACVGYVCVCGGLEGMVALGSSHSGAVSVVTSGLRHDDESSLQTLLHPSDLLQ